MKNGINQMKQSIVLLLLVGAILLRVESGHSQTTFTSIASGDWTNNAIWSCGGCALYPGRGATNDIVIINHSVTLNSSSGTLFFGGATNPTIGQLTIASNSATVATLQVGGASSPTASDGSNSGGRSVLVNGNVGIQTSSTPAEASLHLYDNGTATITGNLQVLRNFEGGAVPRLRVYHFAHLSVGTIGNSNYLEYKYDDDTGTSDGITEIQLGNGSADDLGVPQMTVNGDFRLVQDSNGSGPLQLDFEIAYAGMLTINGNYYQTVSECTNGALIQTRFRRHAKLYVNKVAGLGGNFDLKVTDVSSPVSAKNRFYLSGTQSGDPADDLLVTTNGVVSIAGNVSLVQSVALASGLNSNTLRVYGTSMLLVGGDINITASAPLGKHAENLIEFHQNSLFEFGGNISTPLQGSINFEAAPSTPGPTLKLSGASPQVINYRLKTDTYYRNIVVNNSAGVSLSGAITVNDGTITMTNGILTTTSTNLLTLGLNTSGLGNSTTAGGSSTSFISGPVKKQCGIACATTFFSVGKGSTWAPVQMANISNTDNTTSFTTEYFNVPFGTTTTDGSFPKISWREYWNIGTAGTVPSSPSPQVALHWKDACLSDIQDLASTIFAKFNGTAWVETASAVNPSSFVCTDFPSVTGGITGTAVPMSVGNNYLTFGTTDMIGNPLPITVSQFDGFYNGRAVELNWTTSTEINSSHFTIERSIDGLSFEKIGTVQANENSTLLNSYTLSDPVPYHGKNYYRLSETGLDKAESVHGVIFLEVNEDDSEVKVFPNPLSSFEEATVTISPLPRNENFLVYQIYNLSGSIVATGSSPRKTSNQFGIILTEKIVSGNYILLLSSNNRSYSCRIRIN